MIKLPSTVNLMPTQFKSVDDVYPKDFKKYLKDLYWSYDRPQRVLASLLNHCHTSRTAVCFFSTRIAQDCIDQDPNQQQKWKFTANDYARMGMWFGSGEIFSQINYEAKKQDKSLAAFIKLADPWIELMGFTAVEEGEVMRLADKANMGQKKSSKDFF